MKIKTDIKKREIIIQEISDQEAEILFHRLYNPQVCPDNDNRDNVIKLLQLNKIGIKGI